MKKKLLIIFLALAATFCLCLGLSACGEGGSTSTPGQNENIADGNDENSIYTIYKAYVSSAVANSQMPLSYEEWLATIKGEDGKDGLGIEKIEKIEKTSSEGNVDTYTISFIDGTTTTFAITNGKDELPENERGTEGLEYYPLDDGNYGVAAGATKMLSSVVIPEAHNGQPVTTIIFRAFESCKNLKNITIPDSITSIGENAFVSCTSLKSVSI